MQVIKGLEALSEIDATTLTVGSFDGVHSGHSSLLETLTSRAKSENRKSVVVSFSPHPRVTLGRAEGLQLLTSDPEKAQLLGEQGVDILLLLEFNQSFSALSYEEFIVDYLIKRVKMRELIVGFNHHMGHNAGSYDNIAAYANEHNFCATLAKPLSNNGQTVSSTLIRKALAIGDIEGANQLLAYPYLMVGNTTHDGRLLLDEPLKLIPPSGKYQALVNGSEQLIDITTDYSVWCSEPNKEVEIRFINKLT